VKSIRQAVLNAVESGTSDLVACVRIERQDGEVFRFTEHDHPLTMDTGAVYEPNPAILPTSAITYDTDGSGATVDLEGAVDANQITRDEFASGRWDYAQVFLFRTLFSDPVEDDVKDGSARMGEVTIGEPSLSISIVGLAKELKNKVGKQTSVTCPAILGDSDCQVRLDPPTWTADTAVEKRLDNEAESGDIVKPSTENGAYFECSVAGTTGSSEPAWNTSIGGTTTDGSAEWVAITAYRQTDTVQSVTDSQEFTGALGFPDDFFGRGAVTFTSGENDGITTEVQSYQSDVYSLWRALPGVVAVGDTFVAEAGCRKRFFDDCESKFNNAFNNQAISPFAPGPSVTTKFGGQGGS